MSNEDRLNNITKRAESYIDRVTIDRENTMPIEPLQSSVKFAARIGKSSYGFEKGKPKFDPVLANVASSNLVNKLFFDGSSSFEYIESVNMRSFYDRYTNIYASVSGTSKVNAMMKNKTGRLVSADIESLGFNPTSKLSGITEFTYNIHDFSTGKRDSKSVLIGLSDSEYDHLMNMITEIESKGSDKNQRIAIGRLAKYADATIEMDEVTGLYKATGLGDGADELLSVEDVLKKARQGVERLHGGVLKDQTIDSDNVRKFFESFSSIMSQKGTMAAFHNGLAFDVPFLHELSREKNIPMHIDNERVFDFYHVIRSAYLNNPSALYDDLGSVLESSAGGALQLETIAKSLGMSDAFHTSEADTRVLLDIIMHDDGNFMQKVYGRIQDNINAPLYSGTDKAVKPYDLRDGTKLFFPEAVSGYSPIDSFMQRNVDTRGRTSYTRDKYASEHPIQRKSVRTFKGIYRSNNLSVLGLQENAVRQAINSGAVKGDFFVGVLEDAHKNIITLFGATESDIRMKLQNGIPVSNADQDMIEYNLSAIGSGRRHFEEFQRYNVQEMDLAQTRYRKFFSTTEDKSFGSRSFDQAKRMFNTAGYIGSKREAYVDQIMSGYKGEMADSKRRGLRRQFNKRISNLLLHGTDILKDDGDVMISAREVRGRLGGQDGPTYAMLRDLNTMFDTYYSESDIMSKSIKMIEQQIPDKVSGAEIKRKMALKSVHEAYMSKLEESMSGVRDLYIDMPKFGYEKGAIPVPKSLFDSSLKADMLSDDDAFSYVSTLKGGRGVQDIRSMIQNSARKAGIGTTGGTINTKDPRFVAYEKTQVAKFINYMQSTGIISKEAAAKVSGTGLDGYYMLNEAFAEAAKSGIRTPDDTYRIINSGVFTREEALSASRSAAGNINTSEIITNAVKDVRDIPFVTQRDELKRISSALQDIDGISQGASKELEDVISMISGRASKHDMGLSFALVKGKGKYDSYYLAISAAENAAKIAAGRTLGEIPSNTALIELGNIVNFNGVNVITKGGYQQVAGKHVDLYNAVKNSDIRQARLLDSFTYGIAKMKSLVGVAVDSMADGDFEYAGKLLSKGMNSAMQDLPRVSQDALIEGMLPSEMDYASSNKVYTNELVYFGSKQFGKLGGAGEAQINSAMRSVFGGELSEVKKQRLVKDTLDIDNITYVLDSMLGKDVRDPINRELEKYMASTGMSRKEAASLWFASHEGDFNNKLSAFMTHPSAFHPFGWMYNPSRPVGRQQLAGGTIFADTVKGKFKAGTQVSTYLEEEILDMMSAGSGKRVESQITGKVLMMSQKELESMLSGAIQENRGIMPDAVLDRMQKRFSRLNVTNQESIVASDVASVFRHNMKQVFHEGEAFRMDKGIMESISKNGFTNVSQEQLLGYEYDKTLGSLREVRAKFSGTLKGQDNHYLLTAGGQANDVLKLGIYGTEKSVGLILDEQETSFLRKYLGDFSMIGNFELLKHEASNAAMTNAIAEALGSGADAAKVAEDARRMLYPLEQIRKMAPGTRLETGGMSEGDTLARAISYDSSKNKILVESVDRLKYITKAEEEAVSRARASALNEFQKKYGVNINKSVTVGGNSVRYQQYTAGIRMLQLVDDIAEDKGVKIDLRNIESTFRALDDSNKPILKPLYDYMLSPLTSGQDTGMLMDGEVNRLKGAKSDVAGMREFLKRYMLGEQGGELSSVNNIDSIMDIPIYKKRTQFEDLTRNMQTDRVRLFGVDEDFVRLKLPFKVSGFGKGNETVSDLILPNVYMSHVGDNIYASTNYQKSLKHLMSAAEEYSSKRALLSPEAKDARVLLEDAVRSIYGSIYQDFSSKEGALYNLSYVRLNNSGLALNKEVFRPNSVFGAGSSGLEDVVYMSEQYAKRLMGDNWTDEYGALMKGEGTFGILGRFPTIYENSSKVAKFKIADDKMLGGRQVAIFGHTSLGLNADVDADNLSIALLDRRNLPTDVQNSISARYSRQIAQNEVASLLLQDSYAKEHGFGKFAGDWNSLFDWMKSKGKRSPFTNQISPENVSSIWEAYMGKGNIGKANTPGYMLRQYGVAALEAGALGHGEGAREKLRLLNSFSEAAEQKMIDYKFGTAENPVDMYMRAIYHGDSNSAMRAIELSRKNVSGEMVRNYLYESGNVDLAKTYIKMSAEGQANFASKMYDQLMDITYDVMRSSGKLMQSTPALTMGIKGLTELQTEQVVRGGFTALSNGAGQYLNKAIGASTSPLNMEEVSDNSLNVLTKYTNSAKIEGVWVKTDDYIGETVAKAQQGAINAATTARDIISGSKLLRNAGIALGALIIGNAIINPNPVKTRSADDAGLTEDENGPMPVYQFPRSAPVMMNQQQGMQININATNANGLNEDQIHELLGNAFGGNVNVRMNFTDDRRKVNSQYIQDLMLNSIG